MHSNGFPGLFPNAISPLSFSNLKDDSRSIYVDKGEISIQIKKLIHTRETPFHDLMIIPFRSGKFTVNGSVICEELENPQQIHFTIYVSE
jgi:hypothetical protein